MTRFRVPAASVLTLLLVAANLLSQTVSGQTPSGTFTPDLDVEVQQVSLGSTLPCVNFQPSALANYLLAWSGYLPQARCCEQAAKCDGCPAAATHAKVVSKNSPTIRIEFTVKNSSGEFSTSCLQAIGEAALKLWCGKLGLECPECCPKACIVSCPPATAAKCCVEAAACCKECVTVVSRPASAKASCACGATCACSPKTCKCGTDCACKEEDKKAQRRAARRAAAAAVPLFTMPLSDGDSPLPRGPLPMLMPARPMPPQGMQIFFGPNGVAHGCLDENFFLNNPHMAPMPAPSRFVSIMSQAPMPCDQLVVEPCPGVQQTRFLNTFTTRSAARVGVEMSGLEVQCDRLIRNADGKLVCEGDVCLTLTRANHPSKIRAERVVLNPDGSFEVGTATCEAVKPIPRP